MSENQQALEKAYQLIEAGQLGEARGVLQRVLADNQHSADAWWLYAHAVEDPKQAVMALENVRRLDPSNAEATNLLQIARQQVDMTSASDDDFDSDINFDADDELAFRADDKPDDSRKRNIVIFGSIIGLALLVVLILTRSPYGGSEQLTTTPAGTFISQGANPTPTIDAIQNLTGVLATNTPPNLATQTKPPSLNIMNTATPMPNTDTSQINPTNIVIVPTQEPAEISTESFLASLSPDYPTNGTTETVDTVLGATLLVPMCTARGDAHSQLIPNAMNGLSQHINRLPSDYVGVGVRFLDCSTNETINVIVIPTLSALEYKNNDLSEQDFRRAWRVVDV